MTNQSWGSGPLWRSGPAAAGAALPDRVEALVIGGGITGTSLLAHLSAAGVDAWLVERHHLAAGASGRNAGFLLAGVASSYAAATEAYGRTLAAEVWDLTRRSHALLVESLHGRPAGYLRRGSVVLAAGDDEAAELERSATWLREDSFAVTWDGRARVLVSPGDGELDPAAAVRAIAAAHPDRVVEGRSATSLESPAEADCRVAFADGEVRAGLVILATNAFTSPLVPLPIAPVRGQLLASAPTAAIAEPRPVYSDRGYRYWRQLEDGRVLVGGFRDRARDQEVGFEVEPTAAVQQHLDAHLRELGVTAPVTHRWAGTMGFSPDGLPLVGMVPGMPGVAVCAGYTGHGMGFASACSKLLVESLTGSSALPAWLSPARFGARTP